MDPSFESFLRRPLYQRASVLIAIIGLVIVGFYFGLYQGQLEEMASLERRLDVATSKLAENQRIAANLPMFRAEYERLQAQLNEALSELPDKKELPKLLRAVGELAREQGLEVLKFKPAPEVTKGFYAEVPVDLQLRGSYHDVALFFDAVSNLPRIVNIDKLKMGQPKVEVNRTTLKVDCRATTFRFIDTPQATSKKTGKK